MNKLISVIVPIYNVEPYLKRCIDSIINQTYKTIEIILVDDGSTDNSSKICDEYKNKDKRIKVIHKKNGGLSSARNRGLDIAKGKYITFIDSDDYVDNDYIEYLYNLIKKYKTKMSICIARVKYENGKIIDKENNKEMLLNQKETLEKMLYQNDINVSSWAKMYDRNLFKKIRFPEGKIFEDTYTTYKLVLKCNNISIGVVSKYNYMIRSNSILTSTFNLNKLSLIDAYLEMGNMSVKKYPELYKASVRANVYANLSTLRQMMYATNRLKDKEKNIKKYVIKNSKIVLLDKLAPIRDKIGIITLILGIPVYKLSWTIYSKFTGRIYK